VVTQKPVGAAAPPWRETPNTPQPNPSRPGGRSYLIGTYMQGPSGNAKTGRSGGPAAKGFG